MSTPIADTASNFAERDAASNSKRKPPAPLRIFPSSTRTSTNTNTKPSDPNQLLSPESPESRRPPITQSITDFDPKLQWQRVIKRLPNRHPRSRKSSQDVINDDHGSDNEENDENYEMTVHSLGSRFAPNRRNSLQHQQYIQPNEEDDILPSAEECGTSDNINNEHLPNGKEEGTEEGTEEGSNYFTNPFGTMKPEEEPATPTLEAVMAEDLNKKKKKWEKKEKKRLKKQQKKQGQGQDVVVPTEESGITTGDENDDALAARTAAEESAIEEAAGDIQLLEAQAENGGRAKKHWGKTFDKVRLIANLHTLPHQYIKSDATTTINSSSSLAPYYPPLFDPVFIALSKDQHQHPWPPVLLSFLKISITDSELSTQGINQWIFRIELQYGDIKWVIKRTIAEFVHLHYTLKFKSRLSDAVPSPPSFPSQLESWLSSAKGTIRIDTDGIDDTSGEKYKIALKRRKALTKYLRKLIMRAHMKANYDICEFLEISAVSIVEDMGWKGKEGFLENKVNFVVPRFCHIIKPHLWNKQWVILRDSYVAFISDISSTTIEDVFLFDKSLIVQNKTPGILGKYHNHITMENQFRRIEIKGGRRENEQWMKSIQRVLSDSPWVKNHRFGSFAPIRHNSKLRWFVDAEDHFNAVGEAILSAKSEIYIADWWLSPELYLRRPPEKNEEFRLDRLLKRKAEEGVKIYIIVYKEMAVALTINSAHTKLWLQNLHKNIIVVRHPDHRSTSNNILFWSHHEKIVVVDNRLAFIGGLDLCWGRYDSHTHRLTDYPAEGHANEVFPGQDYSNPRVKDFFNIAQYDLTLVDRNITPRMPWHDMTVGMVGPVARDVARHFIQRWNFVKASKGMHRPTVPFLMPKGEYVSSRDESKFKGTCRTQLLRSSAQWSSGIDREHSIYNAYMECISKSKHYIYIENQFFISSTTYDKILRNKIAQAIVERIKRAHAKGEKYKVFIMIPLIPAFEGDLASKDASAARNVMHFQYVTISRGGNSIIEKLREANIEPSDYIGWYSLRTWDKLVPPKKSTTGSSASATSKPNSKKSDFNFKSPELKKSTATTTTDTIKSSDNNKSPSINSPALSNSTKETISSATESLQADPITSPSPYVTPVPSASNTNTQTTEEVKDIWDDDDREHYVSELVYIHDKILIVDDRIVLIGSANINDRSQLGNRDSEIAMLIEDTEMVSSFMDGKEFKATKFAHSLRMQLFKEHLGLLDFNSWEQLLNGDSSPELAQPTLSTDGVAPDTYHAADQTITEEEIKSFESLGPDKVLESEKRSGTNAATDLENQKTIRWDAKALDPLADHCCQDIWNATAKTNTLIYRELFRCVPDDTVHTFEQHRKFLPDPTKIPHGHVADPELHGRDIKSKLDKVRGHLVQFPSDYLKDENMLGSLIRETVTPMVIFT